jgi:hypothetical protein
MNQVKTLKILLHAVVLCIAVGAVSCTTPAGACSTNATKATLQDYTGLDGCRWVIKLKDGTVLEPINLEEFSLQPIDGLPVWVEYKTEPLASICMVGETVRVTCISKR